MENQKGLSASAVSPHQCGVAWAERGALPTTRLPRGPRDRWCNGSTESRDHARGEACEQRVYDRMRNSEHAGGCFVGEIMRKPGPESYNIIFPITRDRPGASLDAAHVQAVGQGVSRPHSTVVVPSPYHHRVAKDVCSLCKSGTRGQAVSMAVSLHPSARIAPRVSNIARRGDAGSNLRAVRNA